MRRIREGAPLLLVAPSDSLQARDVGLAWLFAVLAVGLGWARRGDARPSAWPRSEHVGRPLA